ncbi:conserved hypothetical protein [uncultured Pleomorphomonas sp.]|uniref:DUF1064 domain-containing protein n=1 Tax=uncultured Pleomorphomonas sp. TaxID=442121 RepID=A0A212L2R6_9HYPH|nr:DUF1064 domain-containing protein [uncultured Pleomorphomonas sp.]SCM71649.1 conserved hypothetical protein [uncultured Pleomorphomonas sp.]
MPKSILNRLPRSVCGSVAKYHNHKCIVDGLSFDSKREAEHYQVLLLLQRAGQISNLRRQVRYDLMVNGIKICSYIADCVYDDNRTGMIVVEDVKSGPTKTREYRLKKKLMKACLGIDIVEVM